MRTRGRDVSYKAFKGIDFFKGCQVVLVLQICRKMVLTIIQIMKHNVARRKSFFMVLINLSTVLHLRFNSCTSCFVLVHGVTLHHAPFLQRGIANTSK